MLNFDERYGLATTHLQPVTGDQQLHSAAIEAWQQMQRDAQQQGVELAIASGYRSFQRQAQIWNAKWQGQRTLLDQQGKPLVNEQLSVGEKLAAILHWSALPGLSRHHWGSDFDVYDPRPFADETRQLQLVPSEYVDDNGPCYQAWCWLRQHAKHYGFFFPYARYQGGVASEPWHLSYRAVSVPTLKQLSVADYRQVLAAQPIAGMAIIVEQLPEIFEKYVNNICEDDGWTDIWCGYSSP
ncbi:D-alanyl-D-alanine carboxypeptidase [Idiomarina tyrosinivorans]|uniref:D-alanyl-D-alanine carboxypeptidase n=1 Tax=Idiomarina tyrosinivorans TaxID=1445662 RepID=A0A432ZU69_9GAMM|nr:M15 family metallopeptidase [Idiomarina tyrosinivorans]RUO81460.1 D-alanyl-D-alanine carboxypeptidase [Idiomarina tyrosinivorans]